MLNYYYGTELTGLADELIERLNAEPLQNPLSPEIFVVQNHGIGQWLSLYIAGKEGVAANQKFEFPSERIWKLIRMLDDSIPETLPSDRVPMTWSLMEMLREEKVLSSFNELRQYISKGEAGNEEARRWKLCTKIADVFDQYLIYRPDMILKWERKPGEGGSSTERWQSRLWNRLIEYWEQFHAGDKLHRARMQQTLLDRIREGAVDEGKLPERLTVFGISSMPPVFVEILGGIARWTKVDFYQLCVDPEVREASDFDNPLLASLAGEPTKFRTLFHKLDTVNYIGVEREVGGRGSTLLDQLHLHLKQDRVPDNDKKKAQIDDSIRVHSCHSPMREVEVLYDQLLDILEDNPGINPEDILVMTPDIDTYAPIIEAVFGMPDEGQPKIPFGIADLDIKKDKQAIRTYLKVLELCESRFKLTDVLDLLDMRPVQQTFGIEDEDLGRIERWVDENRIRWGIDETFKKELGLPGNENFTWKAGLSRILLGYAMAPDEEHLYGDMYPFGDIETSDDAELAGKLSHFLNALFHLQNAVDKAKAPSRWTQILHKAVDQFLPAESELFWEKSKIRSTIRQVGEKSSLGGFSRAIPFRIVRLWVKEQLEGGKTGGGQMGRGVIFSSLTPMRTIPFKVIGLIGMNEDAFPRSKIPVEFDLMNLHPRKGDPNRAEEDRYLFLETLLAAGSHLYFSYVGRGNRQDMTYPPSTVLSEFLDYLRQYHGAEEGSITTGHRLQAFSPAYYTTEELFSYSKSSQDTALELGRGHSQKFWEQLPEADPSWKQITVDELVSFFQHPAKYTLRNRLGIYLDEEKVLTDDREPFELEKLDQYLVKQELLDRYLDGRPLEPFQKILKARDMLPQGWSGDRAFDSSAEDTRQFGDRIKMQLDQQQMADLEVDVEVAGFRITGKLSRIYADARMEYRFGKGRPKYKIQFWIRHLLFQLAKEKSHPGESILFCWDKNLKKYVLNPVEDARSILEQLVGWYWEGLAKPLPFYSKSSYAFAKETIEKGNTVEEGIEKAVKKWEPGFNGFPGEGDDPYNKLTVERKHPFHNSGFIGISRVFWTPFFEVLTEERGQ